MKLSFPFLHATCGLVESIMKRANVASDAELACGLDGGSVILSISIRCFYFLEFSHLFSILKNIVTIVIEP